MDTHDVLPPGQHPLDSCRGDIDQLAFALTRVQVLLKWIDEHRASFEKVRETDREGAEAELRHLEDSTDQAVVHLQRLTELILAGFTIDRTKPMPRDFCDETWDRWVAILRRQRKIDRGTA